MADTKVIQSKKVFKGTEFGSELTAHVNHKKQLYIEIEIPDEKWYSGWLTLNKESANDLVKHLQDQIKLM